MNDRSMKSIKCQLVRSKIEEAEVDWQPSSNVREHLQTCQQCRTFLEDQIALRQLIGSLGQVAAPPDFDFRLRARLAEQKSNHKTVFGGFLFGVPSITIAGLLVVLGTVLVFKVMRTETGSVAVDKPVQTSVPVTKEPTADPGKLAAAVKPPATEPAAKDLPKSNRAQTQIQKQVATARRNRSATKDFSSVPAGVIRSEQPIASAAQIFPIDSSYQTLKLSLDDDSGVSRTISLPRVSFGSQRVLSGEQTTLVKTSTRGAW